MRSVIPSSIARSPDRDWFAGDSGERRFIVALIVLAAVLRFLHLGYQSVWVDEMLTIDQSTPKDGFPIWHLLLHNIHGPLHSFVVYLFRLVHDGDAWLRVPSALAGVAAVAVFYRWTRYYFDVHVARLAALLLAVNPLHIYYSQEVRNYAFVFFFAMVACVAFERLRERATWRRAAEYGLAMVAAALSNFTAAFLFAAHTAIYFGRGGERGAKLRRWAAVSAMILVLISPWVYRIYTYIDVTALVTPVMPGEIEAAERLRGETTVSWTAIPYAVYTFSVGFTMGPSLRELHDDASIAGVLARHWPTVLWTAAVFGALVLAGIVSGRTRRWRRAELAVYFLFPIALTLLLNWQNAKAFNVRYVLLALPAYLCVVAAGIASLSKRWRTVASAAVVFTMLSSLVQFYYNGRYAKEDVRGAVRYVEKRMEFYGDDACLLAPTVQHVARRYRTGTYPIYEVFQRRWLAKSRVDAQLEPVFAACNSVWYVRARPWVDDNDGYVWRWLLGRYRVAEETQFDGVKVFLLQKRNPGDDSI